MDEVAAMDTYQTRADRCDQGNCTREANGSYKGHSLCEQHLQQFVAMQSR